MSRIFINYRRQDSEGYVGRLYDHLLQHFRRDDIFMDVDSIKPGVDFVQALEDAVSACDVFIAVIGRQWESIADESGARRLDQWNDFVRIELASALKQNKIVIPLLVGGAKMPAPTSLPEDIAAVCRRNAYEISHQRFAYEVEQLASVIRERLSPATHLKPKADPATLEHKAAALKQLRAEVVAATDSPLYKFRIENGLYPVVGDGSPDAAIFFIGESPGKNESEVGKPFVGPSGEVLDEMLRGIALRREDVFITNILLDRPPEKREPLQSEIDFYAPFVDRLLDIIEPAVIVPLGRFAMSYILKKYDAPDKTGKISTLHGKLMQARVNDRNIHIVPMYHPAVVLYSAGQRETLQKDFEKLRAFV